MYSHYFRGIPAELCPCDIAVTESRLSCDDGGGEAAPRQLAREKEDQKRQLLIELTTIPRVQRGVAVTSPL